MSRIFTVACLVGILDDVLAYLAAALQLPDTESRTFEIGGADQASYGDVMREYARQRGLKRVMFRGLLRAIARRAVEDDAHPQRAAAGVPL